MVIFCVAISVSAQVKWNAADSVRENNTTVFKGEVNGGPESIELANITFTAEGYDDWQYKESTSDDWTYNGQTYGASQVQGQNNGMTGYLVHSSGNSSCAHFVSTVDGTLDVAFKFGYNKRFYVAKLTDAQLDEADFSTDMSAYAYNDAQYWGGYWSDADSTYYYELDESGNPILREQTNTIVYAGCTLNLTAGDHYYVWFAGSKLMLCGFTFTASSTEAAKTISSNATIVKTEYYNILGVKLSQPTNGVNIVRKLMSDGSVVTSKTLIYR